MVVPEYFIVYDSNGEPACFLSPDDGITNCFVDCRLNGESTFPFSIPQESLKLQHLTPESYIYADGRDYIFLKDDAITPSMDTQGRMWVDCLPVERQAELDYEFCEVPVNNDPAIDSPSDLAVIIVSGGSNLTGGLYVTGTAKHAMAAILDGSTWTVGIVDVPGIHDIETEKLSRLANLKRVQEIWGGYLVFHSHTRVVDLRAEDTWQNYNGFQVRYAKNMKNVSRVQNNKIYTRLYPFGEDNLDIGSVNDGRKYIENKSYTSRTLIGIYENQELKTPEEVLAKATEVLAIISRPRYSYRFKIVDQRTLPGYTHETFAVGDMIDVFDDEALQVVSRTQTDVLISEYAYYTFEQIGDMTWQQLISRMVSLPGVGASMVRILRHRYEYFQPWNCELEVGDPESRFIEKIKNSIDAGDYIKDILRPNRSQNNLLKGIINTFTTLVKSDNGFLQWDDDSLEAIETDETGNPTGNMVRLSPGGLGVSTDGGATFANAITGLGVLADHVIANTIHILHIEEDGLTLDGVNGVAINSEDGLVVTRGDGLFMSTFNATDGILMQKRDTPTGLWETVLYADDDGILHATELWTDKIRVYNGSDLLIDADNKLIDFTKFTTIVGKLSADNIETDELVVGVNVTMGATATITWSQISDPPEGVTLPDYIQSTYIGPTSILSPNITGGIITGGQIIGGSITSNTSININTNAYIGDNLYLGDGDVFDGKSIYFHNSVNITSGAGALSYGLYLNCECLDFSGYLWGTWDFTEATVTGIVAKFA